MKTTSDPYADLAALFLGEELEVATASPTATEPAPPAATDARERVEIVLPGNLPVMGSLWIAQYADLLGCRHGPVALCRFAAGEVTVEVFRAGAARSGLESAEDLESAVRDLSGLVERWLVVPADPGELDVPPAAATATILTGADDAAVVGAYRLLKRLVEKWNETSIDWPAFGLAVLGSDDGDATGVAAKINRTARAFLNRELRVTATRQRMEPLESCARRTFATGTLDAVTLCRSIVNRLRKERRKELAASREAGEPARPRPAAGLRLAPKPAAAAPRIEAIEPIEPIELRPAMAPTTAARPSASSAAPASLALLIGGLRPLAPRCPTARGVELACDAAGGLHLVASPASLSDLPATSAWVRAQRELLALACPELTAFEREPTRHVVAEDPATAIPLVGSGITVHLRASGGSLVTLG